MVTRRFAGPRLKDPLAVRRARSANSPARSMTAIATAGAALSMIVVAASACWSQGTQGTQGTSAPPALGVREPPPQAAPPPNEGVPPPAREEKPGLINEVGKLFEKALSILPQIKRPS